MYATYFCFKYAAKKKTSFITIYGFSFATDAGSMSTHTWCCLDRRAWCGELVLIKNICLIYVQVLHSLLWISCFLSFHFLAVFILSCRIRPPPSVVVSSSPWPHQPQQHNSSDAFPAVTNTWKSDRLRRLPWGFIWKQKNETRRTDSAAFNCFLCRLLRRKVVGLKCTSVAAEFGTWRRSQAAFTCATCPSAAGNTW